MGADTQDSDLTGRDRSWSRARQVTIAALGIATLAAGGTATFVSSNGAGSAGLIACGAVLLLVVLLGEKIEWMKLGDVEFHLRRAAGELSRQADVLEARGDTGAAEQLREEARKLLVRASPSARAYEELRQRMPPGPDRLVELSRIVRDAREHSRAEHPSAEAIREIFSSGSDGERVYALVLMQESPDTDHLDCILDTILHPRSAFEQGQALAAALKVAPLLGPRGKSQLREIVQGDLTSGGHIARSTDRLSLARALLSLLSIENS